jgi:methylmalonyl-CoA mutase
VLQEESHLERVVDPAGGSWYLESLTEELATKAWEFFQQVERAGGMLAALESGWVAGQIESAFAPRAKNLARRKDGITGVSEFPNVAETPVVRHPPDRSTLVRAAVERLRAARREVWPAQATVVATAIAAASAGASIGHLARQLGFHQEPTVVAPISPHPFAEPFEELRASSDAWAARHGHHPRVFLANMGSPTHHTARATYAKNFFEAGGFEVISNNGFRDAAAAAQAFASSEARIAVICSSDKLYPEAVPALAPQLKSAGATTIVLAGNPGANEADWRAAGVDRFIFVKCDVLATLREMLRQEGVLLT